MLLSHQQGSSYSSKTTRLWLARDNSLMISKDFHRLVDKLDKVVNSFVMMTASRFRKVRSVVVPRGRAWRTCLKLNDHHRIPSSHCGSAIFISNGPPRTDTRVPSTLVTPLMINTSFTPARFLLLQNQSYCVVISHKLLRLEKKSFITERLPPLGRQTR
jgi:hypothetical protein